MHDCSPNRSDFYNGRNRSSNTHFGFDIDALQDGFGFAPIAISLIGISEIMLSAEARLKSGPMPEIKGVLPNKEEWNSALKAIGRGTGLGFIKDLFPGDKSVISALMSYA